MRKASAPNPVTPMASSTPPMTACSGRVLIRIRYGRHAGGPKRRRMAHTIPITNTNPAASPTAE